MSSNVKPEQDARLDASDSGHSSFFTHQVNLVLIWLIAGSVSCSIALLWLPTIYIDGQYIPAGVDSFYHARRILDVVNTGLFFQFDPKIHAPEGALLSWPWAYDYLIAQIVLIVKLIFNIDDPMVIIAHLPPAWTFVNVAILLGITSLLNLSYPLRLLAALCFALLPLTQELHGAGRIDHHFMEHTMVLLTVYSGINWFRSNKSTQSSILFGLVLGFSSGINNGLFILQIPLVITLFILWVRNKLPDKARLSTLGATLLLGTLLILIPSEPFQRGLNSYYYLSLFHLYIACCSAFAIFYVAKFTYSRKSLVTLGLCGTVLIGGILPQLISGSEFILADIQTYKNIPETVNIFNKIYTSGILSVLSAYTTLLLVAPFLLVYMVYLLKNKMDPALTFFAVSCAFGLVMLALQLRLNYFGSIALYLPVLVIFNELFKKQSLSSKTIWAGLIAVITIAYLPTLSHHDTQAPVGRSYDYSLTRDIYPAIQKACENQPGVVLAEYSDGNTIRFHSECSVIANNMIITPKDVRKVLFIEKLMSMSASQLQQQYPWIKYVFIRRNDNIMQNEPVETVLKKNKGLREELLLRGNNFPGEYQLIKQLSIRLPDGSVTPFARLFTINRINN